MIGDEFDEEIEDIIMRQLAIIAAICNHINSADDTNVVVVNRIITVSLFWKGMLETIPDDDYERYKDYINNIANCLMLTSGYIDKVLNPPTNKELVNDLLSIHANLVMSLVEKLPNSHKYISNPSDLSAVNFAI